MIPSPPPQGEGGAQRRVGGDGALSIEESSDHRIDAAIGAIGGLAGGLLGVGGGFVMVPLQVIWAKRSQHRATGTSLAAIVPIAIVAATTYYFGRSSPQTDLTVAFFVAVGGVVGAFFGSLAARRISDRTLSMIFAILLVAVGLKEVYDALGGAAPHLAATTISALPPWNYAVITVGGVVVGIASGLTGVGGGTLIVPLLGLGFGIGQRIAQGTSLVAVLPTSAIGALTRYGGGDVNLKAATWMGVAGAPAAVAGSALALWLPQRSLGGLFGLFLLFAAARTWPRRSDRPAASA
jgi:uncharacterized membrane protein YfcA